MVSLPIFLACVSTCRYRDSLAATPSESRSATPSSGAPLHWEITFTSPPIIVRSLYVVVQILQARSQNPFVHEVLEQLLAVERHHRDPLQEPGVQGVVALDVDLAERRADPLQDRARVVAQMAAGAAVE